MTASVLQEVQTTGNGTAVSSISVSLPNPTTAGSALHVPVQYYWQSTSYAISATDSLSSVFSTYDAAAFSAVTAYAAQCIAENITSGTDAIAVDTSGGVDYLAVWAREIGGVSRSALDGHGITFSSADAASLSLSITNVNEPALISAVGFDGQGSLDTSTEIADTFGWTYGGGTDQGLSSHKRLTAAGPNTVTYTGGSAVMGIWAAAFDEAPAGAALVGTLSDTTTANATLTNYAPPGWIPLDEWNSEATSRARVVLKRILTYPIALPFPFARLTPNPGPGFEPMGTVINIYPVTVGTSGSFTIMDGGTVVFTIAVEDIVQGVPIPVGISCASDITVSSIPTGGEYGVYCEIDSIQAMWINEGNSPWG